LQGIRRNNPNICYPSRSLICLALFALIVVVFGFATHVYPSTQQQTNQSSQTGNKTTFSESYCNKDLRAQAITSTGNQPQNNRSNVVDNNLVTRWSSDGVGSWILFDLGNESTVCDIDIAWYRGDSRAYRFTVALANETGGYTNVFAGRSSGSQNHTETYDFKDTIARYIEIAISGNTDQNPFSSTFAAVTEVGLHGNGVPTTPPPTTPPPTTPPPTTPPPTTPPPTTPPPTTPPPTTPPPTFLGSNAKQGSQVNQTLSVNSDKPKYAPGQIIRLFGNASDLDGTSIETIVKLETKKTHNIKPEFPLWPFNFIYTKASANESVPLHKVVVGSKNGSFSDTVWNLGSGKYMISANASVNGANLTDWTSFEVMDWISSPTFFTLLLMMAAAAGLIPTIIFFNEGKSYRSEFARFICISGIALLPLVAFFLTDVEFGTNAIAGLVYKHELDQNGKILLDNNGQPIRQWVVNFGGDATSNYRSGIQFPFYVFAFGLLGGYLRYLVKTFRKGGITGTRHRQMILDEATSKIDDQTELWYRFWLAHGEIIEEDEERVRTEVGKEFNGVQRTQFLRETLSELAELLLAPVLAIVSYFLLYQGSAPNIYTVAILSFAVGLVTKDVVERIEDYARTKLDSQDKKDDSNTS
jgi:hypothetical protein